MEYKTQPYAHQVRALEQSAHRQDFALLMEMRTGKSKVVIDTAALMYEQGKIDALLIVAPSGVTRQWIESQVPTHLHDSVPHIALWHGAPRRTYKLLQDTLLRQSGKLAVYAMHYEAINTLAGYDLAKKFLTTYRTLFVADESQRIKSPKAQRTKRLLELAPLAAARRILTGTPVEQSPLDVYTQFMFLDPEILGHKSFWTFQARYAELLDESHYLYRHVSARAGGRKVRVGATDGDGRPKYKNLPELQAKIAAYSFRVRQDECNDMPPKMYERLRYTMSPAQQRAYNEARRGITPELPAVEKLQQARALQQILCNVVPAAWREANIDSIDSREHPRLQLLMDYIEDIDASTIIWAQEHRNLDDICAGLDAVGASFIRYDGTRTAEERAAAQRAFQAGEVQFFVGTPAAGGLGLDLFAADVIIYYNNGFKLGERLQSEERAQRVGKKSTVLCVDIECETSIDTRVIDALRGKRDFLQTVLNDPPQAWI